MKKPRSSDNLNGAAGGPAIALLEIAARDPESSPRKEVESDLSLNKDEKSEKEPGESPVEKQIEAVENTPQNNECKMVDLRGAKVASFTVEGCELICLPQAFDLFLKHLVGGLHTVYTKLKRLEITPVVCNVEQVRILRGLGAIQPGVNRCKLISRKDFETLYNDCTNARLAHAPSRCTLCTGMLCGPELSALALPARQSAGTREASGPSPVRPVL
ncbi:Dachshund like protein 1 [Fukomys damarensis]|uniref:Dachshund like protein 1 n=1 Tax=Fukomys damarensis TaxID=885580 RepID=A0A091CR22_FUKDA|nr:Dachshund like protein 1 [Fukomys damarensis]